MSWRLFVCPGCNVTPKLDAASRQTCSYCVGEFSRIMSMYTILCHEYPLLRTESPSVVIGRAIAKSIPDERIRESLRDVFRKSVEQGALGSEDELEGVF